MADLAGENFFGSFELGLILGSQCLNLCKWFEITGVESIDALDVVRQHGRDDLQIEYRCASDGTTPKQIKPALHRAGGDGQDVKK